MLGFDFTGYLFFAFVTSITPGPNNYLLFAFGKQYGFKQSGKLMLGIFVGFTVLLYIAGYGIGELIAKHRTVELVLKLISSVWLLYLAYALSKLQTSNINDTLPKVGFYKGFLMQFVNPKAWIMAISGAGAFLPKLGNIHSSVFVFAFSFGIVGVPCMISWVSFGDYISKILTSAKANTILGYVLFGLMLISILFIWL
jgi:threonine/homoserine/homoserine lactone efflux protein